MTTKEIAEAVEDAIKVMWPEIKASIIDEYLISNVPKGKKRSVPMFVYIAKQLNEGDVYKIGIASSISDRVKAFTTGNIYINVIASKKTESARELESFIHDMLKDKNISGEWFRLCRNELNGIVESLGFSLHIGSDRRGS